MSGKGSGKVRIIGGRFKRTPITVLDAEGLRPTGDRQRETIFNWLNFLLGSFEAKRSLDMFAGTGVLSLEFLSRGGAESVAFEKNRAAASQIKAIADKLSANLKIYAEDCLTSAKISESSPYDVVFIDPPFALNLQMQAFSRCLPFLSRDGLVYIESPNEIGEDILETMNMVSIRRSKGGASFLLLAQKRR